MVFCCPRSPRTASFEAPEVANPAPCKIVPPDVFHKDHVPTPESLCTKEVVPVTWDDDLCFQLDDIGMTSNPAYSHTAHHVEEDVIVDSPEDSEIEKPADLEEMLAEVRLLYDTISSRYGSSVLGTVSMAVLDAIKTLEATVSTYDVSAKEDTSKEVFVTFTTTYERALKCMENEVERLNSTQFIDAVRRKLRHVTRD